LSSEDKVQKVIREGREILATKTSDDFLKYVEKNILEIEKEDRLVESVILWNFVAEAMENVEETDIVAYAYSKLISRYLILEDIPKAEEIYKLSNEKELTSFHLDTVRTIFERRKHSPSNREIIKIHKMDIFGDLDIIPASPSTYFESSALVRRYIHNNLPKGTYSVTILNHKNKNKEEIEISTEDLIEYEVISMEEIVRID
jgi:hypothetical protein